MFNQIAIAQEYRCDLSRIIRKKNLYMFNPIAIAQEYRCDFSRIIQRRVCICIEANMVSLWGIMVSKSHVRVTMKLLKLWFGYCLTPR